MQACPGAKLGVVFALLAGATFGCESPRGREPDVAALDERATPTRVRGSQGTLPPGPLSLDACVKLAEESTPTARSFHARLEAARAAVEAAETWPNPVGEWTGEDMGVQDRSSQDVNRNFRSQFLQQETISYPILTFWTKGLEIDAARAQETRDAAGVEEDRRQLRLEVGRAYYEILADQEAVGLAEESLDAAQKLRAAADRRKALGDVSGLDQRRAQTEEIVAKRDLELARRKRDLDALSFSLVLGANPPVFVVLKDPWPEGLPSEIAPSTSASETELATALAERALARRPDVKAAEAEALRASTAQDLEARRALPLAQINVAAGAREGPNGLGATVIVNGPLPILDRNQGPRHRAAAENEAALAELDKARRRVVVEVHAAVVEWTRARASVEEFARPIVEGREAALESTRRLFAAGEVAYIDVISAQRDAVEARKSLLDARKDAALARWRLVVAVGNG